MKSIYKYVVDTAENGIIKGPITKLLTAQVQHGVLVVWAEVDTDKADRKFQIIPIGTGWNLDAPSDKTCVLDSHTYLSTVQYAGGSLVFHVYAAEILPAPVKNREDVNKKATAGAEMNKNFNKAKKESYTVTTVINPEILAHFIR
jgi:hypothetical protein